MQPGFVSGEHKQLLLQGANLFVLPSHHENFGLAVLEALAAGTPVLVSDRVALSAQVARHRLGRVVPLEVPALREGLRDLLENRPPENLREWVASRYSWEVNAASLIELYTSILAGRR